MTTRRSVFVTVGMSDFPFDRLIGALDAIVDDHDVFAQIGASTIVPRCAHARTIDPIELENRIAEADVVICHGGNTVRVAQRHGKAPIVVPRQERYGEMSNDHQVRFVEHERDRSPLIVLDDGDDLVAAVDQLLDIEDRLLTERPVPTRSHADEVRRRLKAALQETPGNPFTKHFKARFGWAWERLANLDGIHLDLGAGHGEFAAGLAESTARPVIAADVALDKLFVDDQFAPSMVALGNRLDLPISAESIGSVSMLDVLEHVWDEDAVLAEVHRVLAPGGTLIVTVPRHHALSVMDPDNVKFRAPRLHRWIYSARFGRDRWEERFGRTDNGMVGDLAIERGWHTNYRAEELFATLDRAGFDVIEHDAANLLWRFFDIPRLLLPERLKPLTHAALNWDGRIFHHANLFVRAVRR